MRMHERGDSVGMDINIPMVVSAPSLHRTYIIYDGAI